MISVELINGNYMKELYKHWGEFSCECYNTPIEYAERVGHACANQSHFSGSRTEYFKFRIRGISRACSLQLNRHKIGVELNQQSQRYCDMNGVNFVIPPTIAENQEALKKYTELMEQSIKTYGEIQQILKSQGKNKEGANQDARYCLLESCETQGTWGFTLEALIHFMHKRLCIRSQWEIRQLANLMKKEVISVLPELENTLVPHCEYLMWCPEGSHCCGKFPTRQQVIDNNFIVTK
ncbi:thymidylate synthase (FAD) [Hathewaya proteolytica DSM 3090]|uniref:FAD-dependent thymidylate synthase n=1 Tax=Hathewaya proteolytica DSM 3090 TaxID=1121331 RepID=A0A1M6QMS3_9CLOT|nr:FAD-dependent thymidylate synthase [Hathewaya proteolytica]SHK21579.1 thymidylate synthase (FAD) [Hathewaya proteolytica DSM 3090]